MHNRTLFFGNKLLKRGRHFDYWHQSLIMRMRVCYVVPWSWTVLLPSDTRRKPITSIAALLLPIVTYSYVLTFPRTMQPLFFFFNWTTLLQMIIFRHARFWAGCSPFGNARNA
jgi:hypothetical protein